MSNKKVLVIGLDGATWDLMRPWAEKGILPTFKKLMEKGVYGDLKSTLPPITGPAWVSFATGKNPGKHGIYDFVLPKNGLDKIRSITAEDINGETFYEILDKNGINSILINMPCSYPPRINKIVITSILTKGENCIFPLNLVEEIPEFKDYRMVPDLSLKAKRKIVEHIEDIRNLEANRFECAKRLFKEKYWDFFFLLFSGSDWVQHEMYYKLSSEVTRENSEDIKLGMNLFEDLDGYIKWFIDNLPPNTNILFMSDHGFCSFNGTFFINTWLEKNGYLKIDLKSKHQQIPGHKFAEKLENAEKRKRHIKVPVLLFKYLKSSNGVLSRSIVSFYRRILYKVLPIEIKIEQAGPNLYESIAYAISYTSRAIYINTKDKFLNGMVEVEEYEEIRSKIIDELKNLKIPETGENVFKDVLRKEDVYSGKSLDKAPDIILVLDKYFIGTSRYYTIFTEGITNDHALEGIFLAYGPDIKKGVEIQNAKIYDLAPTILHIFGIPIPKDMDGGVLKDIFKEDSELAKGEIVYQKIDEKKIMKERIEKLKTLRKI